MKCLLVAGVCSGCGKTSLTLGLLRAFARRGLCAQPFKAGPDFIDPGLHALASGRVSHNLDSWMLSPEANRDIFARSAHGADVAVIEGAMGLFDGASGAGDSGSAASLAKLLGAPVALVVDASGMGASVAALAQGFAGFDPELEFAGVILNRIGSPNHREIVSQAVRLANIPVLGLLPKAPLLCLPSRHLGLITAEDLAATPAGRDMFDELADWVEAGVDVDALLAGLPETVDHGGSAVLGQSGSDAFEAVDHGGSAVLGQSNGIDLKTIPYRIGARTASPLANSDESWRKKRPGPSGQAWGGVRSRAGAECSSNVFKPARRESQPRQTTGQKCPGPPDRTQILASGEPVLLGVARDNAFSFMYAENLRLLEMAGARLVFFSPLGDQSLPAPPGGLGGLYLPGGYPELNAQELSANVSMLAALREFCRSGRPVYAECGGFMLLTRGIADLEGRIHPMAGVFDCETRMNKRFAALGYREVTLTRETILGPAGATARGHEFHYSSLRTPPDVPTAYRLSGRHGAIDAREGFVSGNTLGSYVHLHFASNPGLAVHFVQAMRQGLRPWTPPEEAPPPLDASAKGLPPFGIPF